MAGRLPIKTFVDGEGHTWGGAREWAERHGISLVSAYARLRRMNINFSGEAFDYDDADWRWKASSRTANPAAMKEQQKEEAELRRRMKAAGMDESLLESGKKSTYHRPPESVRRGRRLDAIKRMLNVKEEAAAASNDTVTEDLGSFEATGNANTDVRTESIERTSPAPAVRPAASPASPYASGTGLTIDDIDTLALDEFVDRLIATTGMNHKMAAEYTAKMVEIKKRVHDLRETIASLVPLALVRDFEAGVLTELRNALIPIGGELRDDLAACGDPVRCQEMVDGRIYGALRQVAQYRVEHQLPPMAVQQPQQQGLQ